VLDLHRQLAHAHAGGVAHRNRDGGGQADLSDPFRADRINLGVR
jgi:hypothetical protein